jgi:hypothetical protein
MDALAISLLGFKISGYFLLGAAVIVVVIVGIAWFMLTRQRR